MMKQLTAKQLYKLYQACETGTLEKLKRAVQAGFDLTTDDNQVVKIAADSGHLEMLKWIVEESGQQVDVTAEDNYAARWAIANNHLEVIKYLVLKTSQPVDVTVQRNWAVGVAASHGYLDIVKWLVEESGQAVDVTAEDNYAVRHAIMYGHLKVVQWLVRDSGQQVDVTADYAALRWAVQNQHLDVLRWLFTESGCHVDVNHVFDATTLRNIRTEKQKEFLSWVLEESGQLHPLFLAELLHSPELPRKLMETLAVIGYGVDPKPYRKINDLYRQLAQLTPTSEAAPLVRLLTKLHVPIDQRQPYYVSSVCRKMAAAGLVSSKTQLDELLLHVTRGEATRRL